MHRPTLALMALMLLAFPVHAQDDAKKLIEAMEQKLAKAKAYKVNFQCDSSQDGDVFQFKGTLTLAAGNRFKMTFEIVENNRTSKGVVVSDGKVRHVQGDGRIHEPVPQHEKHFEYFTGLFAKLGYMMGSEMMRGDDLVDPSKVLLVGLQLAGKEKIEDREANLIEYPLDFDAKGADNVTCKLWLDSQTGLPVKRAVEWTQGEKTITFVTETYGQWELDPNIPEETFALPK